MKKIYFLIFTLYLSAQIEAQHNLNGVWKDVNDTAFKNCYLIIAQDKDSVFVNHYLEFNGTPMVEYGKGIIKKDSVMYNVNVSLAIPGWSTKGTHKYPTEQFRQLYSVDWAWKTGKKIQAIRRGGHNKRHEKEYNFVFPMLLCKCCCWAGFQIVPIGDST